MNDAVTQPAPGWYPASMAAAALLRSLGGSTARLLIPQPLAAAPADNGLALTAETDEALLLDPVLVRRNMDGSALEVMVAAETLRAALGIDDDQRPEDTMGLEARLEINLQRYRIQAVEAEFQGGLEYLYKFRVEA
jgi:hypothetical protein